MIGMAGSIYKLVRKMCSGAIYADLDASFAKVFMRTCLKGVCLGCVHNTS